MPASPHQQRGVALLTALLVMAVAVMVAAAVITSQFYDIKIQGNLQDLQRAYQYASGVEQTAGIWLQRDLKLNQTDSLKDTWATELPELPIKEGDTIIGSFSGKIEDAQAYFNVNNILDDKGKAQFWAQKFFTDLTNVQQLPTNLSIVLTDWMDKDSNVISADSAEADYYLTGLKPYLAANNLLADASELYLLRNESLEADEKNRKMRELLKTLIALPKNTTININTAPEALLKAIIPDKYNDIMTKRIETPYDAAALSQLIAGLGDFPAATGEKNKDPNNQDDQATKDKKAAERTANWQKVFGVQSNYFYLKGLIKIGKARLNTQSLLERTASGEIRILQRRFEYTTEQPKANESS